MTKLRLPVPFYQEASARSCRRAKARRYALGVVPHHPPEVEAQVLDGGESRASRHLLDGEVGGLREVPGARDALPDQPFAGRDPRWPSRNRRWKVRRLMPACRARSPTLSSSSR